MLNPILSFFRKKIYVALTLLLLVLIIGVLGYKLISGYTWVDSIYMTVITITTVGFGEVQPLDETSKLFTVFLILTSVIIVGYALSIITEYILSRNNLEDLKRKKMQKKIDSLQNHTIICGYGRNGKQAAKKLMSYKKPFVIIEKDKEIIEKFESEMIPMVHGNANEDDILMLAGLDRASTLISALPSDADNLFVVLSARQLNKNACIISRASQETSYQKLKLAGANNVILPDIIGGDHMASLVVVPDLIEFIDNLAVGGNEDVNIEEIDVDRLYNTSSKVQTIKDLDLRNKTGCTVIGYKNCDGEYVVNPEAEIKLVPNSKVIVLGRPEQIQKMNSIYELD
ncbi:TrkA family potassium uptake protein [Lacinutrix sp. 5H-3-7-4]|uniref:potassium channel family protein n=1 Tax=Lacinutrix sp. (strain 5H-3-7-4) TaxID=983544 RepID=UPI00020A3B80|nr:potassium channel protein [Lacinutrix sp. 5H-3-7-4]AEH01658.1 TrkA-N domain protein [Lacinutrix sp. 5H-3-7-4]